MVLIHTLPLTFFSTPIFHGFLEPTLIFVSEMHVQKTKCVSTKFGQTHGRFMASWNTTKFILILFKDSNSTTVFEQTIRTTNKAHLAALFALSLASNCHQEILIAFIFQTFWGIPRHHGHTVKCTGCPPFFLQLVHNPKLLGDQLFAITYMLFCVK